jgi:hypothetical protein
MVFWSDADAPVGRCFSDELLQVRECDGEVILEPKHWEGKKVRVAAAVTGSREDSDATADYAEGKWFLVLGGDQTEWGGGSQRLSCKQAVVGKEIWGGRPQS